MEESTTAITGNNTLKKGPEIEAEISTTDIFTTEEIEKETLAFPEPKISISTCENCETEPTTAEGKTKLKTEQSISGPSTIKESVSEIQVKLETEQSKEAESMESAESTKEIKQTETIIINEEHATLSSKQAVTEQTLELDTHKITESTSGVEQTEGKVKSHVI